ncbi:hypothetical protein JCM8208_007075 [Rhodotorula glutinis]
MLVNAAVTLSFAASLAAASSSGHHARRDHHALARRAFKGPVAPRMARIRRSQATSDNSTTSSDSKYTSTAIWWKEAGWVGSCGVEIKESDSVVALPLALYPDVRSKSSLCGSTVTVKSTQSGKTISATVVGASNRDDYTTFSKSAYVALEGDLDAGELAIEYYLDGAKIDVSNLAVQTTSEAPVAVETTSSKAPKPTTTTSTQERVAVTTAAVVQAAVKPSSSSAAPTTTSAAPAATSAASSDENDEVCDESSASTDESDDDWVCDDEEDSTSSSSSAWVAPSSSSTSQWVAPSSSKAAATTTSQWVAPTTTTTSQWVAPTTTSSSQAAASTKVADTSGSVSLLSKAGIQGFLGDNSNAILSWYNTNSGQDSTNGNSWCGFPYDNNVPGVAPSLKTMLNNFGGDYEAAAKAYCGLELVVSTPDGKSKTMYIADAFDDTWVLTPSSLDIIHGSFTDLYGSYTDNKNDVVKGASWKFTGQRNDKYKFKSTNSLS